MKTSIATLIILSLAACVRADAYSVNWSSVNSGSGQSAGGAFKISCTLGQPAMGFVNCADLLHWVGFWAEEIPSPTVVTNIADVKLLPDGELVSISGKIATSDAGDFGQFFYIEDPQRANGIRVSASPSGISGLARGSVVNVIGALGTTISGERQLAGSIVIVAATATPLTSLGMSGRSLASGTGLDSTGLLIKTWGLVKSTGTGYVEIDDGSGLLRVDTSALALQPVQDSYIGVIGISSLYESSGQRLRLVLPRGSDSITPY